jgi:hypothetical protein
MFPMQTAAMYEEIVQNMVQEQTLNNHSIISTKDTATSLSIHEPSLHPHLTCMDYLDLFGIICSHSEVMRLSCFQTPSSMSNAFQGKFQKSCA